MNGRRHSGGEGWGEDSEQERTSEESDCRFSESHIRFVRMALPSHASVALHTRSESRIIYPSRRQNASRPTGPTPLRAAQKSAGPRSTVGTYPGCNGARSSRTRSYYSRKLARNRRTRPGDSPGRASRRPWRAGVSRSGGGCLGRRGRGWRSRRQSSGP
jgi:hypothetical protein